MHPVLSTRRPLVFAHRGGALLRPENTIAAFDHALACGADGLELDVRLSSDGVPVVVHDATLDRTTNASGSVERLTAAELAQVDAAHWFGADRGFPFRGQGFGMPRLRDVLARYATLPLILELKGTDRRLAQEVYGVVSAAGASERVCFGGFSGAMLSHIRRTNGHIVTSAARWETRLALYKSRLGWPLGLTPFRAFQVPECSGRTRVVSPKFIRAAHRAGLVVQVWTVNEPEDMRRLLSWGVNAIITDRPDVAVAVVKEYLTES